jgi:hypothetical protein
MNRALMIHLPVIDPAKALARRAHPVPNPTPPPVSAPTTRNLFGHVAGITAALAIFTRGSQPPTQPDAELLALCAEAERMVDQSDEVDLPEGAIDTDDRAAVDNFYAHLARTREVHLAASQIPATTHAGRVAKANLVRRWMAPGRDGVLPQYADEYERLAFSLVDDVVGRAGV